MQEALFAVAAGLGVTVLEVSDRAGVVLGGDGDSVFAVRMTDYARRTGSEQRAADPGPARPGPPGGRGDGVPTSGGPGR
jgi:hypothetical protein